MYTFVIVVNKRRVFLWKTINSLVESKACARDNHTDYGMTGAGNSGWNLGRLGGRLSYEESVHMLCVNLSRVYPKMLVDKLDVRFCLVA